jgi:hypothetical protein
MIKMEKWRRWTVRTVFWKLDFITADKSFARKTFSPVFCFVCYI